MRLFPHFEKHCEQDKNIVEMVVINERSRSNPSSIKQLHLAGSDGAGVVGFDLS